MFVDSDDYLYDNSIELLMQRAKVSNAEIVCGSVSKYKNNKIYNEVQCDIFSSNDLIKMCNKTVGTAWGKLYKRTLWDNIRFFENYAFEDTIIYMNILPSACSYSYVKEPIYCFRSSNTSLYKRQKNSPEALDSLWIVLSCVEKFIDTENNITDEYIQLYIWQICVVMFERIEKLDSKQIMQDSFVIASTFYNKYICNGRNIKFKGKNRRIYRYMHKSFKEMDYNLFKVGCSILINSISK